MPLSQTAFTMSATLSDVWIVDNEYFGQFDYEKIYFNVSFLVFTIHMIIHTAGTF